MFHQMITNARNCWLTSSRCSVMDLIDYFENVGQLRDVQIDALKTYLFLKIGCDCKPLFRLFLEGRFNTLDLQMVELSSATRQYLGSHPGAAALFEYACLKNDAGEQVSPLLEQQIRENPDAINYKQVFFDAFYKVSYTDYLFSLPMGAGKTYLMAAFIFLDLYFAMNEPNNPAFAHNFIILAPSGLKSSVVPSLKTIQKFEPSWVLPEPAASTIKRMISFEVLDQNKTAKKSNKAKNPNVQKIANHQPLSELFGLVAVTNAEKVILDRIEEKGGQISWFDESSDDKDRQANELRNLIGKLPSLSVFIDEVHHAVSEEKKLRAVVNRWMEGNTVNSVVGFSGTPYLDKAGKIEVTDTLKIGTAEITNTVYYYPLIEGVGNFLKRPVVKIADIADSRRIIENGVREFLDAYKDTVYSDETTAKLGIYCGTIERLEELAYPLVSQIVQEYGLSTDCILRFHKGNTQKRREGKRIYPQPADSQMQFDILDNPISKIRVVLLVQIGKEGWDCRSLTGIILSQEGDCPNNMVLQTSCRCLRQVDKGKPETALIYLNRANGDFLTTQLRQHHHISLNEFTSGNSKSEVLKRYDRTGYLKLPMVGFYQLKVSYETILEREVDPEKGIADAAVKRAQNIVRSTDFTLENLRIDIDDKERGTELAVFSQWMYGLVRSSMGTLTMEQMCQYQDKLHTVFETITYESNGSRYFSSKFDRMGTEANIRKAFCQQRDYRSKTECIPEAASLLNIANFSPAVHAHDISKYFPEQDVVEKIILDDKGKLKADEKLLQMMELAKQTEQTQLLEIIQKQIVSHPQKDRSFHYLPYHTDSGFEQVFLREVLPLSEVEQFGLEVYYNGDRAMTEFKIKCYKAAIHGWTYVGMYTPDFLIIKRKDGHIHKVLIVETKGRIYANDPTFTDKRVFMQSEFLRQNNSAFGYERFEYLYLEDTLSDKERIVRTHEKICEFFEETI